MRPSFKENEYFGPRFWFQFTMTPNHSSCFTVRFDVLCHWISTCVRAEENFTCAGDVSSGPINSQSHVLFHHFLFFFFKLCIYLSNNWLLFMFLILAYQSNAPQITGSGRMFYSGLYCKESESLWCSYINIIVINICTYWMFPDVNVNPTK